MSEEKAIRIVHVDDRDENRYIVSKILRSAGFKVIEGKTGKEALELATSLPDLIILDVRLPDMLGYEVSRRLKSNPATQSIPIIQLSASFVSNESRVQALNSGADQYLTQPVEPPVLIASVKALLRMQKAEAISRISARQWQTTFDALSEGIGLLDTKNMVLRCNRAMSELLGRSYGQVEGRNCGELLNETIGARLEDFNDMSRRHIHEMQSGMRWYRVTVDPVLDNDGKPAGSILVIAEITSQKLTEEALKVTEKLAATGRLAHSIAHEINNPLEAVTNIIYLMKPLCDNDSQARKYLEMADEELSRVSRITKQTLSFHRDTSGTVEVSLSELMDNVLGLYAQRMQEKGVTVRKSYRSHITIAAQPGGLRQVFSNLIANAIDASYEGGRIAINIYDSSSWRDPAQKGVRVVIHDNGKGVAAADRKRIFEAFFTTKELKGSGLGLWLSLGIISKQGGTIGMRSSTRKGASGTSFSIFLPRKKEIESAISA